MPIRSSFVPPISVSSDSSANLRFTMPQHHNQRRGNPNRQGQHRGGREGRGNNPQNSSIGDHIPSPYNFVPLSSRIFFPDGDKPELISMDCPFSDGISGTFRLKVTAKTPIYIRNGGVHPTDQQAKLNSNDYQDFFKVTGNNGASYAIPGTSLKGMLRNVVEIAGFGKMIGSPKGPKVDDHRYAVRDLRNPELYNNHITETINGSFRPKVKAAWLDASNETWSLILCDFARVEQSDLERLFQCQLGRKETAAQKYQKIQPYTEINFDCGPEQDHSHSRGNRLRYKKATNLQTGDDSSKTKGTVVLTGQPMSREERNEETGRWEAKEGRKHMEFIFFHPDSKALALTGQLKQDFIFAHSELGENRRPNDEWGFWNRRENKQKIPVFVLLDENGTPSSMGLAMMYRLPYKHSIHQTIAHTSNDHSDQKQLDLAEAIFGRVEDKSGLRGRATIETLVAEGSPQTMSVVTTVLNGPKPSYYPNYVKQPGAENGKLANGAQYKTYMDDDAEIRGWKRYIVRSDMSDGLSVDAPPTDNIATRFRPLPANTTFTGTIHLHNLRPFELGALIWAITWGGDDSLRHSLGMAKPYGFGSVTLEIIQEDFQWCNPAKSDPIASESLRQAFVDRMKDFLPDWSDSPQLTALQALANPSETWPQETRYPKLGQGRGNNEFEEHKKARHALVTPLGVQFKARENREPAREENKPTFDLESEKIKSLARDIQTAQPGDMANQVKRLCEIKDPSNQRELAQTILKRCQAKEFKNARKKAESNADHWLNKAKGLAECERECFND